MYLLPLDSIACTVVSSAPAIVSIFTTIAFIASHYFLNNKFRINASNAKMSLPHQTITCLKRTVFTKVVIGSHYLGSNFNGKDLARHMEDLSK